MIDIQNTKIANLCYPQLKDDGDLADQTYVDTLGWGHARFVIMMGNTDITLGSTAEGTAPKIEECDTSGGTYSDVSGAALADSVAADEDGKIFAIDVDLTKSHKRYMQWNTLHAGNGSTGVNACAFVILSRPEGNGPVSAADMGLTEHIKA